MDFDDRTIFVGNLGPDVTEAILRELFLVAGPIEKIRWQAFGGVRKPFAHITFRYGSSVSYAMEIFEGTQLYRRELVLQLSTNSQRDTGPRQHGHMPQDDFQNGRYEGPPFENEHQDMRRYYPHDQYADRRFENDRRDRRHNNNPRDHYQDRRNDYHPENYHQNRRHERSGHDSHRHGWDRSRWNPYPTSGHRH